MNEIKCPNCTYVIQRRPLLPKIASPQTSGVYCIQAENGLVKIGRSDNIRRRLTALSKSSPVEMWLVGYIDTTVYIDDYLFLEAQLHRKFHKDRVRGEWFDPSENVRRWVAKINALQASGVPADIFNTLLD